MSRKDFIAGYMAGVKTKMSAQSWVDTGGYRPMAICDFGNELIGVIDWDGGFSFDWRIERNDSVVASGVSDSVSKAMRECSNWIKNSRDERGFVAERISDKKAMRKMAWNSVKELSSVAEDFIRHCDDIGNPVSDANDIYEFASYLEQNYK